MAVGMPNVGEVYRGLSIIEQAPLETYKALPSPLRFRLLLVVLWRIILLHELSEFKAKHSVISNSSLGLSYCEIRVKRGEELGTGECAQKSTFLPG